MKAKTKIRLTFLGIFLLAIGAGLMSWPGGPTLPWLGRDSVKVHLGLDMQGGVALLYNADVSKVAEAEQQDKMNGTRELIEKRINSFGVAEPVIQTVHSGNDWRLSVELPGLKDINEAINLIGATPKLEFKVEGPKKERTEEEKKTIRAQNAKQKKKAQKVLKEALKPGADFAALATKNSEDAGAKKGGAIGEVKQGENLPALDDAVFNKAKVGKVYPKLIDTANGYYIILVEKKNKPKEDTIDQTQTAQVRDIYIKTEPVELPDTGPTFVDTGLTGEQLQTAAAVTDPQTGLPIVSLTFNKDGKEKFAELTKNNVGKQIAIYLDGQIVSAPVVNQEIGTGEAQISGNFSLQTAKEMAQSLKTGALPISISLISQQNVGPSLGQESIERSLFAGLLGLVLLSIFMIVYYRVPGLMGVLALFIYSLIVLAVFKLWPITLTLAGVAGFILSIGMAVDANVLIFERMKEELHQGKPVDQSVADGFKRAWTSIRDSNVSSLLTCLILYWFGSSLIRGFAITLAIGIAISMFSAITITRTFLSLFPIKHTWWYGVKRKKTEEV